MVGVTVDIRPAKCPFCDTGSDLCRLYNGRRVEERRAKSERKSAVLRHRVGLNEKSRRDKDGATGRAVGAADGDRLSGEEVGAVGDIGGDAEPLEEGDALREKSEVNRHR